MMPPAGGTLRAEAPPSVYPAPLGSPGQRPKQLPIWRGFFEATGIDEFTGDEFIDLQFAFAFEEFLGRGRGRGGFRRGDALPGGGLPPTAVHSQLALLVKDSITTSPLSSASGRSQPARVAARGCLPWPASERAGGAVAHATGLGRGALPLRAGGCAPHTRRPAMAAEIIGQPAAHQRGVELAVGLPLALPLPMPRGDPQHLGAHLPHAPGRLAAEAARLAADPRPRRRKGMAGVGGWASRALPARSVWPARGKTWPARSAGLAAAG